MEPIIEQLGKFFLTIDDKPYDQNKEYEKLTIVEANNRLYISRVDVPAGIDITNTTYWKAYPIAPFNLDVQLLDVTEEFTSEKYPAEGSSLFYICTDSQGTLSGGRLACHDSLGTLIHNSEIQAGFHVGVHLGDLLIVTNKNNTILIKQITDDEAVVPTDNTLYDGLMTSKDKKTLEDFKLQFNGEQNINNMLNTGFYYGVIGRPEGSEEDEHYHVYVKAADVADGNGNYSIQQTLYDVKYPVKVYQRLGFTTNKANPESVTWQPFNLISGNFIDKGGANANDDVKSGFYGYVADNKPEEATSWGSLAVRRAEKADENGFVSIEQIFYGRNGEDNGKVWFRLMFYNINTQEYQSFNWSSSQGGGSINITDVLSIVPEAGSYSSEEGFIPGTYILKYGNLPATGGTITPTTILYPLIKSIVNGKEVFWYKKPDSVKYSIVSRSGYPASCTINEDTGAIICPANPTTEIQTVKVRISYIINETTYNCDSTTDVIVAAGTPTIKYFTLNPAVSSENPWSFDIGSLNKYIVISYPSDYTGTKNIESYYSRKDIGNVVGELISIQGNHQLTTELFLYQVGSSFTIMDSEDNVIYIPRELEQSGTIDFRAAVNNPGPSETIKTNGVVSLKLYCE